VSLVLSQAAHATHTPRAAGATHTVWTSWLLLLACTLLFVKPHHHRVLFCHRGLFFAQHCDGQLAG
jgi:hypothetical protein